MTYTPALPQGTDNSLAGHHDDVDQYEKVDRWGPLTLRERLGFRSAGRTTEQGRVLVGGKPLEEAEVWRRDHSYPNADLVEILATVGIASGEGAALDDPERGRRHCGRPSRHWPPGATSSPSATRGPRTTSTASRRRACPPSRPCSSSEAPGLPMRWPRRRPASGRRPVTSARTAGGALIVVGSLAAASRTAARELAAMPGVRYVPVEPAPAAGYGAGAGRAAFGRT